MSVPAVAVGSAVPLEQDADAAVQGVAEAVPGRGGRWALELCHCVLSPHT